MSSILKGLQLNELSNKKLGDYKTAAGADATAADKAGDYKRGDKRMSGIIKATKKEFANDKKKKVAEAGMPFRGVGGAFNRGDDERHDLDPTEWYIVKDGKMYKTSVYPNQVQLAIAQGYSRSREEATARATRQGMAEDLDENLNKWFKEKWVRFGPDGKIRGDCARGDDSEGKPKCLPQSKAHSLGKKGRASAAARKRREDPNPERSGKAINVNTKKKSNEDVAEGWKDLAIGGAMALGSLGAGAQTMPNINAQQVELANKYYNVLVQRAKEDGRELDTRTLNVLKAKAQDAAAQKMQKSSPQTQSSGFPSQGSERKVAKDAGQFESQGVAEEQLDEKWSQKYKSSINCANPKGFSQRAHCAGKKKNESVTEATGYIPVNSKEAQDPRYSMAITQDIRPGEVQRQAAKMGFKTDAAGVPPLLMKLQNQLQEIKAGTAR
jgi:hypothetical protein